MDEFSGILARDFGFRPQGKSAPMAASKAAASGGVNLGSGLGRSSTASSSWNQLRSRPKPTSTGDYGYGMSGNRSSPGYDDVFGGPPSYPNPSSDWRAASSSPPPASDSFFESFKDSGTKSSSSLPVYDKPIYDDDLFDGVPGLNISSSMKYDDVFSSISSASNHVSTPPYDNLLENLGTPMPESNSANEERSAVEKEQDLSGFEELIPGFGGSNPHKRREPPQVNEQKPSVSSAKPTTSVAEDPFVVLETPSSSTYSSSGVFCDPLNSESAKGGASSVSEGSFGKVNSFDGLSKSVPTSTGDINESQKEKGYTNDAHDMSCGHHFSGEGPAQQSSADAFESIFPKMHSTKSSDSQKYAGESGRQTSGTYGRNTTADQSPKSYDQLETADDVWLTIDEIPFFTQPTSAPPPSRPPPPFVTKKATCSGNEISENEPLAQPTQSYPYTKDRIRKYVVSPIDELEDFAMGKPQTYPQDHADIFTSEDVTEANSAAAASVAAMKEAMDRAEAKFRHAREVKERDAKSAKSRESAQLERDEQAKIDEHDVEDKENLERIDREREQKEREKKEKERRTEKEREQELERERKTEQARRAAERAKREARERAAVEARLKAERATVEKANAEARQQAEQAAAQRAAAEVRERAAAEARDKAAAAKEKQQKPENDLESFFMSARASSVPRQRATAETMFDVQSPSKGGYDATRTSSGSSSTIRKASSTTNIVDDLSSSFGGPPSCGEFQEIEGVSEERRKARLERHQRTLERAAKALAEKNERDMQVHQEQAERHRIAETLDIEIKRWAAGKEGNLRALLSTLQYVLWPECGWQPVSLTDLITGAAVKKVYRKATLCIHPDKVQQKGATLQQKYIAEKVFDLLKEAWTKLNSQELF